MPANLTRLRKTQLLVTYTALVRYWAWLYKSEAKTMSNLQLIRYCIHSVCTLSSVMSRFSQLPQSVLDAAFQLIEAYKTDPSPRKADLCPGFYRDEVGDPWILPSVRKVQ